MKRNIKRNLLLSLIIISIAVLSITLIACKKPNVDNVPVILTHKLPTEEAPKTTFKNGEFFEVEEITKEEGAKKTPRIPKEWSKANLSSEKLDKLTAGVISTEKKYYDSYKKEWDNLDNPGKKGTDSRILMFYSKDGLSYRFTSAGFSLKSNELVKIAFYVKTVNLVGPLQVSLNSSNINDFNNIITNGKWTRYEYYLKGVPYDKTSLSLTINFGKDNKVKAKGYAFFDNFVKETVSQSDFDNANGAHIIKHDFSALDFDFNNYNGNTTYLSPIDYVRSGDSSSLKYGIVDLENKKTRDDLNLPATFVQLDKNNSKTALALSSTKESNANYISKAPYYQYAKSYYKYSVWIYQTKANLAAFEISNNKSKDLKKQVKTTEINKWTQLTIYARAGEMANVKVYFNLLFADSEKKLIGTLLFDKITAESISMQDYLAINDSDKFDLAIVNEADNKTLETVEGKYKYSPLEKSGLDKNTIKLSFSDLDIASSPNGSATKQMLIEHVSRSASVVSISEPIVLKKDTNIIISLYAKTVDLEEGVKASIGLYKIDENQILGDLIVNFGDVNSLDQLSNESRNGFTQLIFKITGNKEKDEKFLLGFKMGSGSSFDPTGLVKAKMYIADVKILTANPQTMAIEYVPSNNNKEHSFTSKDSSNTVNNGNFNQIDYKTTLSKYSDLDSIYDSNGKLKVLGVPSNWDIQNYDQITNSKKVVAGIYEKSNPLHKAILSADDAIFSDTIGKANNDNIFAIKSTDATAFSIKSPAITLEKEKYYVISIFYSTNGTGNVATVKLLDSSNNTVLGDNKLIGTAKNEWVEKRFYIETGINTTNLNLSLSLGDESDQSSPLPKYNGELFIDNASYFDITKKQFEAAIKNDGLNARLKTDIISPKDAKYYSEGAKPNNWTADDKSTIKGQGNIYHGVFNFNKTELKEKPIFIDKLSPEVLTALKQHEDVLGINNIVKNTLSYDSQSISMALKSYYKVSIDVLTHNLQDSDNANIRLIFSNDEFEFGNAKKRLNTKGKWETYTFYVKTSQKTAQGSVKLKLSLGSAKSLTKGMAFFDNILIESIDETKYDANTSSSSKNSLAIKLVDDETIKPVDDKKDDNKPSRNPDLARYISGGVISAVLVVIILILIIKGTTKKYSEKKKQAQKSSSKPKAQKATGTKTSKKKKKTSNRDRFSK